MKTSDLKFRENPISDRTLKDEQRFIYQYGLFNCKILKFKSVGEVLEIVKGYGLTKEQEYFIVNNSNKEVICYLCHSWEDNPDVFVYGDNNIAFQIECFEYILKNTNAKPT